MHACSRRLTTCGMLRRPCSRCSTVTRASSRAFCYHRSRKGRESAVKTLRRAGRSWLRTDSSAGAATAVAHVPDAELHAAVVASDGVVHIHGRYILAELGDAKHDPFRRVFLQLLEVRTM